MAIADKIKNYLKKNCEFYDMKDVCFVGRGCWSQSKGHGAAEVVCQGGGPLIKDI